ncbi:MAG: alpha/beta hydrolase-fold protein [Candidatus Kapabacteria bacterium]|nr:alpha/beta hydrolase-fold protein [Candidatus Kapabacteria bacterium]
MTSNSVKYYSKFLDREVEINYYGYYGPILLMFPAMSDDAGIYEEQGTIDAIADLIKHGKFRVITVSSINNEIIFEHKLTKKEKSERISAYSHFITEEVFEEVNRITGGSSAIIACGASVGAFIASNVYFKRPDCFIGLISMSGFFNIEYMIPNYFDDECYFNSPKHFLPNLKDDYWLSYIRNCRHIYLFSGKGENERPQYTEWLSLILNGKKINHVCEIWDENFGHNFKTWNAMLRNILKEKF